MAVALAAITGRELTLTRIRAGRAKPGLAAQHLAALRAVATVSSGGIDGLALGAKEITFRPGAIRGGEHRFDVGTAGSVALVLQALLPVMIHAPQPVSVTVRGGTDVRAAPPLDYMSHVLLPLLASLGANVQIEIHRRGYFPRGGGEVTARVRPSSLSAPGVIAPGKVRAIRGIAHTSRLPEHIAQRMSRSAELRLATSGRVSSWEITTDASPAASPGGAVVLIAHRTNTRLGAARVAERGVRAETLGAAAAEELIADLDRDVSLDVHAADQLIVYLALTGGPASFTTRAVTSHTRTVIWLAEQFLPVRFRVEEAAGCARIACESDHAC
jgi:RNA 3'-terminal phosphate cyclase (ATP)